MSGTKRPPLTPADARYAGLGPCGRHRLEWPSQSREGVTHRTYVHEATGRVRCSCEGFAHRGTCKHAVCAPDALAHHLGAPPPADPGGAVGEPPELAGLGECEDAARPAARGLVAGPTPLFDADLAAAIAAPPTLDDLIAAGGERWLVSRSPGRVVLTCASCGGTYRFDGEVQARRFVALALPCDQCGATAGPTPPAQGAARKPIAEHLAVLYGE